MSPQDFLEASFICLHTTGLIQYSYNIIGLVVMYITCVGGKILAPCYEYFRQVP